MYFWSSIKTLQLGVPTVMTTWDKLTYRKFSYLWDKLTYRKFSYLFKTTKYHKEKCL